MIDAAGAKHVIKQSDVDSKKRTGKSVMPDGLQGGLTPADFADLISYLETLRDKAPELPKKTGRCWHPPVGSEEFYPIHAQANPFTPQVLFFVRIGRPFNRTGR